MQIGVCIKQVPEIAEVSINPETGTLIREGIDSILNPFCECALDLAVRFKKRHAAVEIVALSMGPPQARQALMRCLELGADRALLITDRKFAGADTWATALTLASAVRQWLPKVDLLLLGKQAIDGDTAQVGPEVAEILNRPQITYAVDLHPAPHGRRIRVKREVEAGCEILEARLPAVVTVSKGEPIRRLPSFDEVLAARRKPLRVLTAKDLDLPETELGLRGSFTQVTRIFPPPGKSGGRILEGLEPEAAAKEIVRFLKAGRFL
jgi:electron transfer flavoprotein beta subunit